MFRQRVVRLLMPLLILAWDRPAVIGADDQTEFADRTTPDRAVAGRMLHVIDAIVAHHVDPPARQQLVLHAARVMAQEASEPRPIGLARRVSALSTDDDLRDLLAGFWKSARSHSTHKPETLEAVVLGRLFAIVPGPGGVVAAREYAVEQQLAANRYVGIGIALRLNGKTPAMGKVFEGGPAHRAGALENDLILEVDGVETAGKSITDVVKLLRGPEGSEVTVVLQRPDATERRTYALTRGEVPLKTISHNWLHKAGELAGDPSIAYVQIDRIAASTPHELRQIEPELRGCDGLLLDLRMLDGSDLRQAVLVADAFLDGGIIGRVRTSEGTKEIQASRDCLFRGVPLAVLASRHTTGTAEWLAAALQDNRGATIVGEQTPGAAWIAESVPLPDAEFVVVLATGILERASGQALVRTAVESAGGPAVASRRAASDRAARNTPDVPWGVRPDAPVAQAELLRGDAAALKALAAKVFRAKLAPDGQDATE